YPPIKIYNCDNPPGNAKDATFNGPSVYPEYLTDVGVVVCPSDSDATLTFNRFHQDDDPSKPVEACRLARGSYYYLGWAFHESTMLLPGVTVPRTLDIDTGNVGEVVSFALSLFKSEIVLALAEWQATELTPAEKDEA